MKKLVLLCIAVAFIISTVSAQNVLVEGYAYETDNRGYLNEVYVTIYDTNKETVFAKAVSNLEGYFSMELPAGEDFIAVAQKDLFFEKEVQISTKGKGEGDKIFVKTELTREPGYLFDITIAPIRDNEDIDVDGIVGARIEIYNNTTEEELLVIESHPSMNFQFTFKNGNHYTMLIRKDGYFAKRLEAFVNVEGCILCFEGVGDVKPAVTDNLTAGHQMGTLLANIEMRPIEVNEPIPLENIYYDYNSYVIRPDAAIELNKLINVLRDNPFLILELGSHTDSRGDKPFNQVLSQQRAEAAVDYLIVNGEIPAHRIKPRGYGESKLLNKCSSGVECTEEQHAINRRTELMVTGFLKKEPEKMKSLSQIKEDEKIQQMLRDIQNADIVEIPAGGEMPQDLKDQIAKEAKNNLETPTIDEELVEPEDLEKEINDGIGKEKDMQTDIRTFPKHAGSTVQINKQQIEEEEIEPVLTPAYKDDMPIDAPKKVVAEVVTKDSVTSNLTELNEQVNGFLVQVLHSTRLLTPDHEALKDYQKVYFQERANGGFSYLLGVFPSRDAAMESIQNKLAAAFPDAFVVEYRNGQRVK